MATVPGNSTSGLYGIGLSASAPVGNNYGNSNVAAFLTSYQGNLTAGQITVQDGNIYGANIIADQYYWANGVTLVDTLYSDSSVSTYLPTYTGNIAATITQPTQLGIVALGPQVNLTAAANVNLGNFWINNLQDPINAQDSATKNYVDSLAEGLNTRAAVQYATSTNLPACNYLNGTAGVGATITGLVNALLTIDGVIPQVGDRVLIKNQGLALSYMNGIYAVTRNNIGSTFQLTRSTDMNTPQNFYGAFVYVLAGVSNAGSSWICSNSPADPIVIGTSSITFVIVSTGGGNTLTAGQGTNLGNSQINVNVDNYTTYIDGTNAVALNPTFLPNYSGNIGAGGYYLGNIRFASGGTGGNGGGQSNSIYNGTSSVSIPLTDGAVYTIVGNEQGGYLSQTKIFIGNDSGCVTAGGSQTIAIGFNAANTAQGSQAIAMGYNAGYQTQGSQAIAIGALAASQSQGPNAVSIGSSSGTLQSTGAIAIGAGAGYLQGTNSIAIGVNSGYNNLGNPQANNSIIIDATGTQTSLLNSGFYVAPVRNDVGNIAQAVYYNTSTKELTYAPAGGGGGGNTSSLINGSYVFALNADGSMTVPNPGGTGSIASLQFVGDAVAMGSLAGDANQSAYAVAIGQNAGKTNQSQSAVAIGQGAGTTSQNPEAVAIGIFAGQTGQGIQAVAVGPAAGQTNQGNYSTAVGYGANTGVNSLALGRGAQATANNTIVLNASGAGFGSSAVSGFFVKPVRNDLANVAQAVYFNTVTNEMTYAPAGNGSGGGNSTQISNGTTNVSISTTNGPITMLVQGQNAGAITVNSTAIGYLAGDTGQAVEAFAGGSSAGQNNQQRGAVAIGYSAGYNNQQTNAVAIGYQAGYGGSGQGQNSIAIGSNSGATTQGALAVAVGPNAGGQLQGNYAVAIGPNAGTLTQPPSSIMINASATALNGTNAGLYINPVRNDDTSTSNQLFYNTTTNELTWSNAGNPLGVSQIYNTPVRSSGTIYQNTTGSPIFVVISATISGSATFACDAATPPASITANLVTGTYSFIVPNNFYYSLSAGTVNSWKELS